MRKYPLHVLIISFVFFLTPTIQAASDVEREIEELKQAIREALIHVLWVTSNQKNT
jgi:hypothetical protein